MIRPEFKQILMDQRGAAVILWSCFMISIVIYIVIAEHVLANPRFARGFSVAETLRIVLWALVVVDLGYYAYWKNATSRRKRCLLNRKRQSFFAPWKNTKERSKSALPPSSQPMSLARSFFSPSSKPSRFMAWYWLWLAIISSTNICCPG